MEGPNVPSSLISLLPKSPISIGKLALIMAIYAFYVRYVTSTKQIKICWMNEKIIIPNAFPWEDCGYFLFISFILSF